MSIRTNELEKDEGILMRGYFRLIIKGEEDIDSAIIFGDSGPESDFICGITYPAKSVGRRFLR